MATAKPPVKIRHSYVNTYPRTFQESYVGAVADTTKRGWRPALAANTDFSRCSVRVGGRLYVGWGPAAGSGGVKCYNIETGALIFSVAANGRVFALATNGTSIFAGGDFTTFAGVSHVRLAQMDLDGAPSIWGGGGANSNVLGLAYSPTTNKVYAVGDFTLVNGAGAVRFAEIDAVTSVVSVTFALNATGRAVVIDEARNFIYLAGDFTLIGATARNRMARIVLTSVLAIDFWDPNADASVHCMMLSGALVYTGGDFLNVGGAARNRAAAIDQNGTAGIWNPNCNSTVRTLGLYQDTIFLGGAFTTVSATAVNFLAAVTTAGALVTHWVPTPNVQVRSILVFERTVYSAGDFTTVNGVAALYVASVPFPLFTNTNSIYVNASTGKDTNAGTSSLPVETITRALAILAGKPFIAIQDGSTYRERLNIGVAVGIHASGNNMPIISAEVGAIEGTYGARRTGRKKFYTGGASKLYVRKDGNNATAFPNNINRPYLTIQAAVTAANPAGGDCVEIIDDGVYVESVVVGAKPITIQAASGFVPILVTASAAQAALVAGAGFGDIALYGLTIVGPQFQQNIAINAVTLSNTGITDLSDCSITGGTIALQINDVRSLTLANCSFGRNWGDQTSVQSTALVAISQTASANAAYNVTNNFFATESRNPLSLTDNIALDINTVTAQPLNVTLNTISKALSGDTSSFGTATPALRIQCGTAATANAVVVERNYIQNSGVGIFYSEANTGAATGSTVIRGNVIENCQGALITDTRGTGTRTMTIDGNLGSGNGNSTYNTTASFGDFTIQSGNNITLTITNNISMNSKNHAFQIEAINGPGFNTTAFDFRFEHNIAFRPLYDGLIVFRSAVQPAGANPTMSANATCKSNIFWGCQRYALNSFNVNTLATLEARFNFFNQNAAIEVPAGSIFITVVDNPALGTDGLIDVQFISTVLGAEDFGFYPDSLALFSVFDLTTPIDKDSGPNNYLWNFNLDGISVSGLSFVGRKGLYGSVKSNNNNSQLAWCSFSDSQNFAARILGRNAVEVPMVLNSDFSASSNGALLAIPGSSALRSTFRECSSAGLLAFVGGTSVDHCSFYRNGYGLTESIECFGIVSTNNIASGNGFADAKGANTVHQYCDIERISGGVLGIGCIQQNPLFRDPDDDDLRLQAIKAGFFFNSPASGTDSTGNDMGAFSFYYGTLVQTYTEIDFATAGYRNPDSLERREEAIKLFEGVLEDGSTYTGAAAFRTVFDFIWNEEHSDMPNAQRDSLRTLYRSSTGQCQIDFGDGSGFRVMACLREQAFEYTEMSKLYSSDQIPVPLRRLVFREEQP